MKNEFSTETKELFYKGRHCFLCGVTNVPIEFHHICGRQSNSPLNCCRICKLCHEKILHTKEYEEKLFLLTKKYLIKIGYRLTNYDLNFLSNNPHLLGLYL